MRNNYLIRNKVRFTGILATLFIFILLPGTAVGQFGGGQGTEPDPYLVENIDHLDEVRNHSGAYFLQTADIDASVTSGWNGDLGWEPIGTEATPFTGSFNGGGYTITGLFINRPSTSYVGLFGNTSNANLQDINLVNVNITGLDRTGSITGNNITSAVINCTATGTVTGLGNWAGGLMGWNSGHISDCHTAVEVSGNNSVGGVTGFSFDNGSITNTYTTGDVDGNLYVGGIVGFVRINSITNCYSTGTVTGASHIGGISGRNQNTTIDKCFALGDVIGTNENAGGLIGEVIINSNITNSFAAGNVSGNDKVGGLIGLLNNSSLTNTYSTGSVSAYVNSGGLVGATNNGVVTNSYWNTETSNQETSFGGSPRNTTEMTFPYAENTYEAWDFSEIWIADENSDVNNGYPFLIEILSPLFEVTFEINDNEGNAIENAVVTLEAITNDEGDYVFSDMEPGQYNFQVSAPGFEEYSGQLDVVDSDVTVEVVLTELVQYYSVIFNVVDEGDDEITDAQITFDDHQADPGVYTFENLLPETYSYTVSREGYHDATGVAEVVDEDVQITVVLQQIVIPVYTVTFVVEDTDGAEITAAVISFDGVENQPGDYVFLQIQEDDYSYTVQMDGYITVQGDVYVDEDIVINVVMTSDGTSVYDPSLNSFRAYPNPASSILFVETEAAISLLRLFNASGQLVYEAKANSNSHNIDISGLPGGIYFLKLTTTQSIVNHKILISR